MIAMTGCHRYREGEFASPEVSSAARPEELYQPPPKKSPEAQTFGFFIVHICIMSAIAGRLTFHVNLVYF